MTHLDSPRSRRKALTIVVAVIVVLAVAGGAVWARLRAEKSRNSDAVVFSLSGTAGQTAASWSGNGRFAVIAYAGKDGVPAVAVWDRDEDAVRTVDGYQLLFVEPYAAVAWLAPMGDGESDSIDGYGDVIDHKPAHLMAWNLDDGSQPTDNVPSKWHAWPGSGDRVAYLEINVLKGAGPSALLFNNKKSQGEGVKAKLPDDVATFVSIGWSPTGRFFAVEELLEEAAAARDYAKTNPDRAQHLPTRRVLVFDATSGALTSSTELPMDQLTAPIAQWSGTTDTLNWLAAVTPSGDVSSPVEVHAVRAPDAAVEVSSLVECVPDTVNGVVSLRSCGWDTGGPIFSVDGGLWQLTAAGFSARASRIPNGAWSAKGGLLGVQTSGDDSTTWTELVVSGLDGQHARLVWRSPQTPVQHGK